MEAKLRKINQHMQDGNLSSAVVQIYLVYRNLYEEKLRVKSRHMGISFKAIKNSKCGFYGEWRKKFLEFDTNVANHIEVIRKNAYQNNKNYSNMTGEDLLETTIRYRKHCIAFSK